MLLATARRYRVDVEKVARSVRDEFAAKAKKAARKKPDSAASKRTAAAKA